MTINHTQSFDENDKLFFFFLKRFKEKCNLSVNGLMEKETEMTEITISRFIPDSDR
jgi:hypothetical protein